MKAISLLFVTTLTAGALASSGAGCDSSERDTQDPALDDDPTGDPSHDPAEDDSDKDADDGLIRVWDDEVFALYRQDAANGEAALQAYCSAADRPLRYVQANEQLIFEDQERYMVLHGFACKDGAPGDELIAWVPLAGTAGDTMDSTTMTETATVHWIPAESEDLYDYISWDGPLTANHEYAAGALSSVKLILPADSELAPKINAMAAADMVLRQ